jgi:hypothetical protein
MDQVEGGVFELVVGLGLAIEATQPLNEVLDVVGVAAAVGGGARVTEEPLGAGLGEQAAAGRGSGAAGFTEIEEQGGAVNNY